MKKRSHWWLAACSLMLLGIGVAVPAMSDDKGAAGFTEADQAFYLDETQVAFIRPGLELEILDVVIPSDRKPEVSFMISDPAGLPLDRAGIFTPGPVSTSFILSFIPAGETAYVAYTTRVQTSPITGNSATQATSDSGGSYTDLGNGGYKYKFGTTLPTDYDTNATHTLGIYASRSLSEFDLDTYYANELDHFIPSGAGTAVARDITTTVTCNNCHDPLAIHGGSRQEVGLCVLCHNPTQSIDPDTGDSVDMPYMVHKIHNGANLANGYTIIGYRQSVHDYSDVVFPAPINDCEVCHVGGTPTADRPLVADPNPVASCDGTGFGMTSLVWGTDDNVELRINSATGPLFAQAGPEGSVDTGEWVANGMDFLLLDATTGETLQQQNVDLTVFGCANNPPFAHPGEPGAQHSKWMTNPSRMTCGSCHDSINWETGEGHAAGPQEDDEFCSFCHEADSGNEYDRSVAGAHTVNAASTALGGMYVDILEVSNTGPGQNPTVLFSLKTKYGRLDPATLDRLRLVLSGPNSDFDFYVQEDAIGKLVAVGSDWSYTFAAKVPSNAKGSYSVSFEGRTDTVPLGNGDSERSFAENYLTPVAVTDAAPAARRSVVDDATCEGCHSNLSLHGDNRKDASGYCQTCHMPGATDDAVRLEGLDESIHFKYMIHKIHRGAELENGYVVYGYRSSVHDYGHVEYPGDLRNCEGCHNPGTYGLPTPAGALPTNSPNTFITEMPPMTASCLSCHDSLDAAAHADANTSSLGESCAACHGDGKTYSVDRVHAR